MRHLTNCETFEILRYWQAAVKAGVPLLLSRATDVHARLLPPDQAAIYVIDNGDWHRFWSAYHAQNKIAIDA